MPGKSLDMHDIEMFGQFDDVWLGKPHLNVFRFLLLLFSSILFLSYFFPILLKELDSSDIVVLLCTGHDRGTVPGHLNGYTMKVSHFFIYWIFIGYSE